MREIAEKILTISRENLEAALTYDPDDAESRSRFADLRRQYVEMCGVAPELAQAYLDSLQKIERLTEENAPNKQLEHHTLSALIQAEDMVKAWQRGTLSDVDAEEWYLLRDHLRAAKELREEK